MYQVTYLVSEGNLERTVKALHGVTIGNPEVVYIPASGPRLMPAVGSGLVFGKVTTKPEKSNGPFLSGRKENSLRALSIKWLVHQWEAHEKEAFSWLDFKLWVVGTKKRSVGVVGFVIKGLEEGGYIKRIDSGKYLLTPKGKGLRRTP